MKSDSRLPGPRYLLKLYKHAAHLLNLFLVVENVFVAQQVSKTKLARLRLGFFAGMERAVLSPKYRGIRRRCQSREATPWPTRSTCDSSSASYFRRCLTSTRIEELGKRQAAPLTKEQ